MTSLNIMCSICNEFYKPQDKVYSTTKCGHMFHGDCLFRWLDQKPSCPQCREPCFRRRYVHRVFLNFGERTVEDEEVEQRASLTPNWIPLDEAAGTGVAEDVPTGAIRGGTDPEGNDAYVARVYHEEDLLPASYVPNKGGAYAPWNCRAHFLRQDVEVLIGCNCKWVASANGHVPTDALVVGYAETGENLYIGRANYEGNTLLGKVHPSHGVMYLPYNGQEINVKEYEVLVRIPIDSEST